MADMVTKTYVVIGKKFEDGNFLYYSGIDEEVAQTVFECCEETKLYIWRGGKQIEYRVKGKKS